MPAWNRRQFVQACLGAFAALQVSRVRALPDGRSACRLSAEQTEGPYYLDRALLRQDITEGRPGLPLSLQFEVLDARTCRPLAGAALEIWHCDAQGAYSGFSGMGGGMPPPPGPPPGSAPPGQPPPGDRGPGGHPPMPHPTDQLTFLRGVQIADARGRATFRSIFPGYYAGRCNHIHLKLHVGGQTADGHYRGGHTVHTGQLFFSEADSLAAMALPAYQRHGLERMTLQQDNVYTTQHGDQSIATLLPPDGDASRIARLTLAVDPTQQSREGS